MDTEKIIKLQSKEGDFYEIPLEVGKMSGLITESIGEEEDDDDNVPEVPIPNVSSEILKMVIDFCKHYKLEEEMTKIMVPLKSHKLDEIVQEWYAQFVKVEKDTLFDLVAAANFMAIDPLLDLSCLAVAILIKGKSAEELREMFNITPEMEAAEAARQAEQAS